MPPDKLKPTSSDGNIHAHTYIHTHHTYFYTQMLILTSTCNASILYVMYIVVQLQIYTTLTNPNISQIIINIITMNHILF